jgi:hypothetical protein
MVIKFKCPHCQRALSVKEHLAGKRAPCPACKKPLVVPAPQSAPADLEDFAARALADEPQAQLAAATTIDFNCPYCDEALHLPADLGGKQTPCPECRRIIKVPMPAKKDVANWRQVDATPSLARRDNEPAPEGAWESTARARTVSREALEEADAIVEEREPLTLAQKVRRGVYAVGGVAILIVGWVIWSNYTTKSLQAKAIDQARTLVEAKKQNLRPEWAGAVYGALGEYDLRAGKADEAANKLKKARALARSATAAVDRDALLAEIALGQVDLAVGTGDIDQGERLTWADAGTQVKQTLGMIGSPEARVAAVREVSRKLIAKNQWPLAAELVRWLRTGLEPPPPAPGRPAEKKEQKPTVSAQPVALLVAMRRPDKAAIIIPPPPDTKNKKSKTKPDLVTQLIHEEGWPREHQTGAARAFFAKGEGQARERLECLLTVAAVASDDGQAAETAACIEEALRLLPKLSKEEPAPSWMLLGFAKLAIQAGRDGPAKGFTDALREPNLKAWVQLERFRLDAASAQILAEGSWNEAVPDKKSLARGLAYAVYARFKARQGGGSEMLDSVDKAEPADLRSLGYVGVALGMQDRGKN